MSKGESLLPETDRDRRFRIISNWVASIGRLIVIAVVLMPFVWWFTTRARLAPVALEQTTKLYERMRRQDYDSIESEGLAYGGYFDVLIVRDDILNPIESFEIADTTASLAVLPFAVHVKTTRRGVEYHEIAIMHSSRGGYLQVELDADPKIENDILWETNRRREGNEAK